jgi:hypothetical protein
MCSPEALLLAKPVQTIAAFRNYLHMLTWGKAIAVNIRFFVCRYQNYLSKETSDLLLRLLKPVSFFLRFLEI